MFSKRQWKDFNFDSGLDTTRSATGFAPWFEQYSIKSSGEAERAKRVAKICLLGGGGAGFGTPNRVLEPSFFFVLFMRPDFLLTIPYLQ